MQWFMEILTLEAVKNKAKQSQFISVQRSEFCGQRQNEQKYLKKQSQFAGLWPEIRNTKL